MAEAKGFGVVTLLKATLLASGISVISCASNGQPNEAASRESDELVIIEDAEAGGFKPERVAEDTGGVEPPAPGARGSEKDPKAALARRVPDASGLVAGVADDNKQFNYFLGFLNTYGDRVENLIIDVSERIVLQIDDEAGMAVSNATVQVFAGEALLCEGLSYADGSFLFFPSEHDPELVEYRALISYEQSEETVSIPRFGKRSINIILQRLRVIPDPVSLDLLFILDTTGSMGDEIQRLKLTIELINLNLTALALRPRVRFGMVLYKDRQDEYVTHVVPLTEDLESFRRALNAVQASGGGDLPEDLQSALHDGLNKISWNGEGVRLAFVITDATAHLDYGQEHTYVSAVQEARRQGIKIYSVGTSGLDLAGEYVLRQISQYTAAKYIFLTHGEQGESEGGEPGSVSHHTGANYQTDKLEAIIIRVAKEELSHLTDSPLEVDADYFLATKDSDEKREETLRKLFAQALSQLVDYSSIGIRNGTPTAAAPIVPTPDSMALDAEYFSEQLMLSLSQHDVFRMVERRDLQAVLEELELQLSGLLDEKNAAKVGQLIGADLLVISRMYVRDTEYELFLRLLRVETGEILSVTKSVVDRQLGLQYGE